MKKLIVLLAVLIATPVFALNIDMNDLGSGVVAIEYSDANATNLPRAFALDFTIDAPATITLTPASYIQGESSSGTPGFGIYPARIVIDGNGDPTSYGSPLADPLDPGAGDGDGSGNVVLEFGSLYVGDGNAPLTGDTLCTLTIDCNGAVGDVNLTMVDEDLIRGGVLLEDGTPVAVDQTILICEAVATECLSNTAPEYDKWVEFGSPDCWCYRRQCRGDADGLVTFLKPVANPDLTIFKAGYNKTVAALKLIVVSGKPGVCGDFDHLTTFLKPVANPDLTIFKAYYNKTAGEVPECDAAPVITGPYNSWTN